ncbi:NUDIX domain-containing protein [Streptomyces sp. NPDC096012]|uniref:NUDIX hydrolase n=1 Tax=Streptomyces sp. NPDC096012 TaxID=3155684 RepID=UPI00336A582E
MTPEHAVDVVRAVVLYDGRLLLVRGDGGWQLPSGGPQPAESATATAARVVYELTGYLVDGTRALEPHGGARPDGAAAVVCQLLSEAPSDGARLAPEEVRWTPIARTAGATLPPAVRTYLEGHTPV